jgi:hypothetical protein
VEVEGAQHTRPRTGSAWLWLHVASDTRMGWARGMQAHTGGPSISPPTHGRPVQHTRCHSPHTATPQLLIPSSLPPCPPPFRSPTNQSNQIMEEIIAKSRMYRALKAKQKEEDEQALDDLDAAFRDIAAAGAAGRGALAALIKPAGWNK